MGNHRKNKALTTELLECDIRVWLRKEFPKTISQRLRWENAPFAETLPDVNDLIRT
jgi:hypothetical protein